MIERPISPSPRIEGSALEGLLRHELELLNGLLALLAVERDALLERDSARIVTLADEKRRALESAALASANSRGAWLTHSRAALPPNRQSSSTPLRRLLDEVRSAWTSAHRLNLRNGAVMKLHQGSVLRALGVLRQSVGGADLYRADGRTGGHYLSA
jgi:flagellar biosynthesis/type III secretory pathway chaperone